MGTLTLIDIIGSAESSIRVDRDDQYVAKSIVRELRKLAGIGTAPVVYDDTTRTYRVIKSPKAAARLERKGRL